MLLEARSISKRYPGVQALDGVDFSLRAGQIHALVGENGAGKSTLMKILGGIEHADAGQVVLDGQPVSIAGPLDAQRRGIALIHQELNLMADLSVAQNIYFGREPRRGPFIDDAAMAAGARGILLRVGLDIDPTIRLGTLTVAGQQMVEIAKALSMDARILIMDEPTAALSEHEVTQLYAIVREFIAGGDRAVIYISHRLEEIQELCTQVTVLRDGVIVASHPTADLTREDMIALMVGRVIDTSHRPDPHPGGEPKLEVRNLSAGFVRDVSFTVCAGEIFGLAGLVGAGRTETARAIVGADGKEAGDVVVAGKALLATTVEEAVRGGIGYLSEDRKHYGLLLEQSLTQNVALPSLARWSRHGVVDDSFAGEVAERSVDDLAIATPSVEQKVKALSGGNQQKVVIAKWVARDCDVLIFDEPTRGVDVGAKDDIYRLMESLAGEGKAIVVISSEIAELQRVAHRIGVMCQGRLTGVLDNAEATQENIMDLATRFVAAEGEA
ncbi:sugar ABC transporter ATP-binding protein [Trueperella bernardiae]|uniref:sugar ABC transporter ATP-binding protein n=1 Tax=Trueperella bernardiae TaxID=59561 RepID=UPI00288C4B17|nr:sugar ABC transporter ATP-binding protein [Trueperella bernardiae]